MTSTDRRSHANNCNHLRFSPTKQIFQHFASWSDLTNSDPSLVSDQQPSKKRRKGVACVILSTALEAALFALAICYVAYNFWCGNGIEEDLEITRLSSKATLSRPIITNQTLVSSPPPPPYEPRQQVSQKIRMGRTTRKFQSTRPVKSDRLYTTSSAQSSSTPTDTINFLLHSDPAPLINCPFHPKQEIESTNRASNSYAPVNVCEPIMSNESDGDDSEDDDEDLKAFKAHIKGLIKEGREALASKPTIPTSMSLSSSSSSSQSPQISRITNVHRQNDTSTHNPVAVAFSEQSIGSVAQLDENVQLLHLALETAALPSHSNWWEK